MPCLFPLSNQAPPPIHPIPANVDPRWLRGPADARAVAEGCAFDEAAGAFVCDFIENFCRQSKGRWAGQPLMLLDWQRDFLMRLFGWRRSDGTRRYRTAYLEVAKKNGKSTLVSGICLFLLLADGLECAQTEKEGAPEVYINAYDRDQASIVFDEAKRMVQRSPDLAARLDVIDSKKRIIDPIGLGKLQANSADVPSKDGANSSGIVFDELHRQRNRELWEIFEYAGASRTQPLKVSITTAGEDASGIWHEQRQKAERVADGTDPDTAFLGVVYRPKDDADIDEPETWRQANPSLGVTISEDDFRRELADAKLSPAKLANFKRLRLNIIARESGRFLTAETWDACALPPLKPSVRDPLYAGLDLSSINDLAALAALVPDGDGAFDLTLKFWLPEGNIVALEHEHGQPYRAWANAGLITLTPGDVIDYGFIRREINDLAGESDLRKLLVDPFNATQLALELREQDGLPVEVLRQGFLSLSAPTKELLRLVLGHLIRHGGHPILRWMALNAVAEIDAAGNLKLSKKKSRQKIDGMAALVNAVAAATAETDGGPSVYETRGLLSL